MGNATMNMGVQMSFQDPVFSHFVYIPRSRVVESYVILKNILRSSHTIISLLTCHILTARLGR